MAKEPTIPAELVTLVAEMRTDLSDRLGRDDTPLTSIEKMTWNDGSLGCPQPDMMYTMMMVDGYKVVFGTGNSAYNYHTAGTGRFILCE